MAESNINRTTPSDNSIEASRSGGNLDAFSRDSEMNKSSIDAMMNSLGDASKFLPNLEISDDSKAGSGTAKGDAEPSQPPANESREGRTAPQQPGADHSSNNPSAQVERDARKPGGDEVKPQPDKTDHGGKKDGQQSAINRSEQPATDNQPKRPSSHPEMAHSQKPAENQSKAQPQKPSHGDKKGDRPVEPPSPKPPLPSHRSRMRHIR